MSELFGLEGGSLFAEPGVTSSRWESAPLNTLDLHRALAKAMEVGERPAFDHYLVSHFTWQNMLAIRRAFPTCPESIALMVGLSAYGPTEAVVWAAEELFG